jgi:hypothetical protein
MTIGSGMTNDDIRHWVSAGQAAMQGAGEVFAVFEDDSTNFDSSMGAAHNEMYHPMLKYVDPRYLFSYIRASRFVVSTFRYLKKGWNIIIKAKIDDTQKSGQPDTTIANGLKCGGAHVEAGLRYREKQKDDIRQILDEHRVPYTHLDNNGMLALVQNYVSKTFVMLRMWILVNGDDTICLTNCPDAGAFIFAELGKMGLRIKGNVFRSLQNASFCSGYFYKFSGQYYFGCKIGRLLRNFGWTVRPPSAKKRAAHIRGLIACLSQSMGGFPIVKEFLAAASEHHFGIPTALDTDFGDPRKDCFNSDNYALHNVYTCKIPVVRSECIDWMCKFYSVGHGDIPGLTVTPEMIADATSVLVEACRSNEPTLARHPLFDHMYAVDMCDADERGEAMFD